MADEPETTGGDSPYRVALDLMQIVIRRGRDVEASSKDEIIDLFIECRRAVVLGKRRD
jgi:hypothetical protein